MDTSPSPRRRRRSTEGSMTTNTSANPLVSPPQRIRLDQLDQPEDNVFHDVPPSAPSSPTGITIEHLAEMIREQRTNIRTEIRGMEGRMEGRMEERERRMMGALDIRINALFNDIAGTNETLNDAKEAHEENNEGIDIMKHEVDEAAVRKDVAGGDDVNGDMEVDDSEILDKGGGRKEKTVQMGGESNYLEI